MSLKFIHTHLFLFSILFLYSPITTTAQPKCFEMGLISGINFAELEGEGLTDYFGLNAGVLGTACLNSRWQLGMELLFSQNGEYILPTFYPAIAYGKIRLNHLEIPVHLNYLLRVKQKEYTDLRLQLGGAYTRLLSHRIEDELGRVVTNEVLYDKKDGFQIQAGLIYFFNPHLGLNLKSSFATAAELDWTIATRLVYLL